jgi:methionyl aminopeptidase
MVDVSKTFDNINNDVVKQISKLGIGRIIPYKKNLLLDLPRTCLPKTKLTPMKKHIKDQHITQKDLVKIFDVNRKISEVMIDVSRYVKVGADVSKIDELLYQKICTERLYPSVFGYGNFPKASCICVNDSICHAIPYKYTLKDSDIVTIDVCAYNGFHTDVAETYAIGNVNGVHRKLVAANKLCIDSAIQLCKPGQSYNKIGQIVEKIASEHGFQVFKQFSGHGIGKELHMSPCVLNYYDAHVKDIMKEGDMFTIEPLLTCGDASRLRLLSDNSTYVTLDGKYVSHFERTILITNSGCIVLNDF